MIDVLTKAELKIRTADAEAMHRLRYRVFKERLNWDVYSIDGMERDEFDDLDPIYVLAFDEGNKMVGTWRMLPTTGPYMLRDVFPELLEGRPAPCDPMVWECSRFSIDTDAATNGDGLAALGRSTSEIFCGLVEFCLASGIEQIVTVYDVRIARLLPRIGCTPVWRSRSRRIGNSLTLAGAFDINIEVLSKIRRAGGISGSIIRNIPKPAVLTAA